MIRRFLDDNFFPCEDNGVVRIRLLNDGAPLDGGAIQLQASKQVVEGNTGVLLISLLNPPAFLGEMRAFCGAVLPAGWVEGDGSQLSRVDYTDLFAMIPRVSESTTGALNAGMDSSQTSIDCSGWDAWPIASASEGFLPYELKIGNEVMLVQSRTGATTATVARGREGSTPAAHSNAAAVSFPTQPAFGSGDGQTTFNLPLFRKKGAWNQLAPISVQVAQDFNGVRYIIKAK